MSDHCCDFARRHAEELDTELAHVAHNGEPFRSLVFEGREICGVIYCPWCGTRLDLMHGETSAVLLAGATLSEELEVYVDACGNSPPTCQGCESCQPARDALEAWGEACSS